MERMGLVAQVEAELEKMLSLELLPANGILPSEGKLSRCFGVSRGTVREALLRLAAKGLVVTHPGRKAQAVPLGQAVSLENLGVLLDGDGRSRPGRWKLLEGYLALKRDVTVELLAACCETASQADLEQLAQDCLVLGDGAHWDSGDRKWVRQEFDLLRLAALAANRPGHLLLIQSLERSFWSMARWMQPHLASEAVRPWTVCAMRALNEKDAHTLRQQLPALLLAGDERLLLSLAPPCQPTGACAPAPDLSEPPPPVATAPEASQAGGPDQATTNLSDSCTGSCQLLPAGATPPEPVGTGGHQEPASTAAGDDSSPNPEWKWGACLHPPSVQNGETRPLAHSCAPLMATHPCIQRCCCSG